MRILHTGDWHLKDSVADEAAACIDAIIETAKTSEPDLIVIAGDMTDRDDTRLDSKTTRILLAAVYSLAQVAPVAICTGTPYHEGRIPELVNSLNLGRRVHVTIDRPEQLALTMSGLFPYHAELAPRCNALITMFPTPTKRFIEQAGSMQDTDATIEGAIGLMLAGYGVRAHFTGLPHIGVGHFAVRGAYTSEYQQMIGREIEVTKEQLDACNCDAWMLGHIHKAQQIGENIFYSGSIYSKDRGELDDKGFWTHKIDGKGSLESRFWITPAKRRIVVKLDLTTTADLSHFNTLAPLDGDLQAVQTPAFILSTAIVSSTELGEQSHKGAIIHVSYRAWQDEADQIDRARVRQGLIEAGAVDAVVEVLRVPRENVRCKDYFDRPSLIAKLQQQADLREEGPLSVGIANKVAMLETMAAEKIMEELPK